MPLQQNRSFLIRRAEAMLRRADQPRFQMSVIVLVTGGIGFLISYLLLRLGLNAMGLRYPLAVVGAYIAFLGLLWLWLRYQRLRLENAFDIDCSVAGPNAAPSSEFSPGGGQFGGGGASASFDEGSIVTQVNIAPDSTPSSTGTGSAVDVDLDELGLVLIAIAIVAGAVTASIYIIVIAPGLLAEILVDSVLAGALYRRLKHDGSQYWLTSAVKKTWALTLGLAIGLGALGFASQRIVPQANSLGDLLR